MNKIKLKGANNARDFGGIKSKDGKTVRENLFLRSNALHKLTEKDIEILKKKDLKTVIDLRTLVEKDEDPDIEIDEVDYFHIPIFKEEVIGITKENNSDPKKMLDNLPDMSELYKIIVTDEYCVSQIRKVFEIVTDEKREGSVLWHCTQGKDRCGLISAIFLFILGVEKKSVLEDFLNTNISAKKKARLLGSLTFLLRRNRSLAKEVYNIFLAREECFNSAVNAIEEKWGSMDLFIKNQLYISDEKREQFKRKALK